MKISRLFIFAGVILSACVTSYPRFFQTVEETSDPTYGYTAENPVTIKNADLNNSIGASYYYLSRLRTENGNRLELIERYSVRNPNYKKPLVALENRFTGERLNYGTGPLLDLYILKPENELDTLRIYINPFLKGAVKIPVGLKFENE